MTTLLLSLALLVPSAGFAQDEADYEARLTDVAGDVTLYTAEEPDGLPAEKDTPLSPGDRLVTAGGGSAEIALDAEHVVSLREDSDFTLESPAKADTRLKLSLGTLLVKAGKLLKGFNLKVRTPTAVAAVRGTEFGVEVPADKTDETHVGVFDRGEVEVIPEGQAKGDIVGDSQEIRVVRGQRPLPPIQLRRLAKHRRLMRERLSRRPAELRKTWRRMSPEQRQELRAKRRQAMIERRKQRLEKARKGQRTGPSPEQLKKLKEHRKKMDERRGKKGR